MQHQCRLFETVQNSTTTDLEFHVSDGQRFSRSLSTATSVTNLSTSPRASSPRRLHLVTESRSTARRRRLLLLLLGKQTRDKHGRVATTATTTTTPSTPRPALCCPRRRRPPARRRRLVGLCVRRRGGQCGQHRRRVEQTVEDGRKQPGGGQGQRQIGARRGQLLPGNQLRQCRLFGTGVGRLRRREQRAESVSHRLVRHGSIRRPGDGRTWRRRRWKRFGGRRGRAARFLHRQVHGTDVREGQFVVLAM